MEPINVLVTGASGVIAGMLLPSFKQRYSLTLLDIRSTDKDGNEVENCQTVDLLDRNRDHFRSHFRGIDAVVHLGYQQPTNPGDAFDAELSNIQMAYNVFQTAIEEKVGRVVVASSNQAANFYEPLILDGQWDLVSTEMRALASDYYGWAKEAIEHLGFVYAVGKENDTGLEVVQLRIGAPREDDLETIEPGNLRKVRRALAAYISTSDLVQLFQKSIETADIRNEHGIPNQIFYGISNNANAYWSIVDARRVIGYKPQDDSAIRFLDKITMHILTADDSKENC